MDETISAAATGSVVSGPGGRYPLAGAAQEGQECPVRISAALSSGRVTNLTLLKLRNRRNGTLEKTYRNRSHARV